MLQQFNLCFLYLKGSMKGLRSTLPSVESQSILKSYSVLMYNYFSLLCQFCFIVILVFKLFSPIQGMWKTHKKQKKETDIQKSIVRYKRETFYRILFTSSIWGPISWVLSIHNSQWQSKQANSQHFMWGGGGKKKSQSSKVLHYMHFK